VPADHAPAATGIGGWLELNADPDATEVARRFAQFLGVARLADANGTATLYVGGIGVSVRAGTRAGWGKLSVPVDAAVLRRLHDGQCGAPADDTLTVGGLTLQLAEAKAEAADPAPATPAADRLGLGGPAAVRVASYDAMAAAGHLAALFGVEPGRYTEPALNYSVWSVGLAGFAVEFVSSRTAATADRTGAFLASGGERTQSLALPMADLHPVRAVLAGHGIPFTQWGDSVLALPARVLGGGIVELSTTLARQNGTATS
jgi:hypothetical protein